MADTGLLFVYGEVGSKASEEEFNDWYDNEHAPARLTVPGFTNAIRYKATDAKSPRWLAIYDIQSPAVATSTPYKALAAQASDREKALVPRLETLHRRLYDSISVFPEGSQSPDTPAPRYVLVITALVNPEHEDEYNRYHDGEHNTNLSKIPGWLRTRRYKLIDSIELTQNSTTKPVHNYLTIHDWDRHDYTESAEFKASLVPTGIQGHAEFEVRQFELHKEFTRPA